MSIKGSYLFHCKTNKVDGDALLQEEDEESEEPVMDIDTSCVKDPLSVVEYIEDIYAHYRKTEVQLH